MAHWHSLGQPIQHLSFRPGCSLTLRHASIASFSSLCLHASTTFFNSQLLLPWIQIYTSIPFTSSFSSLSPSTFFYVVSKKYSPDRTYIPYRYRCHVMLTPVRQGKRASWSNIDYAPTLTWMLSLYYEISILNPPSHLWSSHSRLQ